MFHDDCVTRVSWCLSLWAIRTSFRRVTIGSAETKHVDALTDSNNMGGSYVTRSRKGLGAIALVAGLGLVAGACSSNKAATTTTAAKAGDTTTSATATTTAPVTTTTAAPPAGGDITVALGDSFGSINSLTAEDSLFSNAIIANDVLPFTFQFNGKGELFMDKNFLDSAELTTPSPQVVTYKINPKAVWSDGTAIDCSDFQLAWISENGTLNAKDAAGADKKDDKGNVVKLFAAATTTGYELISKIDCADGGKTVTTTYSKAFAD